MSEEKTECLAERVNSFFFRGFGFWDQALVHEHLGLTDRHSAEAARACHNP